MPAHVAATTADYLASPVKGLVPSWAKEPKKLSAKSINAGSETITEKPAFRRAAAHRRCLVPADGYDEWEAVDDGKQTLLPALR